MNMNRFSSHLGRIAKKMACITLLVCLLLALSNATMVHAAAMINASMECSSGMSNPILYTGTTISAAGGVYMLVAVTTSPASSVSIADTMGSAYTLVNSSANTYVKTYVYLATLASDMDAWTDHINITSNYSTDACVLAISGLGASPVDGSAVGSNIWSSAMSTAAVTPSTSNSLLVGVFGWSSNVYDATPGTGWTEQKEAGVLQMESRQVSGGSYSASATLNGTDRWAGVVVALKIRPPQPPTDITLSNNTIMSTDPPNTLVGTLAEVDPDTGETYTFSLVSGTGSTNNTSFTIANTNELRTNTSLAAGTYSIRVNVNDGTFDFAKVFTITVNAPQPPTDITLSNNTLASSDPPNTLVGTLAAVDPDVGETYTFTLVSGTGSTNNASFTITNTNQLRTNTSLASGAYSIRVNVNDGTYDFAKVFTITVTAYPTITGGDTQFDDYITNVTFAGINNTSGKSSSPGYQNFTTLTGTVTPGAGYPLSITVNVGCPNPPVASYCYGIVYPQYIKVWFDWNQDYDFGDAGEGYDINTNTTSNGPHTIVVNVPGTATLGATRMRIVNNGDNDADQNPPEPPNAGSTLFYGEAEDYTINVVKAEPSNHPTGFSAIANGASQVTTSWTDSTGGTVPDGYLVLCNTTGTFTNPTDGTPQSDDTNCADGNGVRNIAQGTRTYAWTGLNSGTQYFFKIFPYTNSGSQIDYKTDGTPGTVNATTISVPEMAVLGNNMVINDGDATPSAADHTDFGNVVLGGAITRTFTISNSGGQNLNLTGTLPVAISGAAAGDFTVVSNPATTIAAGATTTFQVRFDSSVVGVRSATVTIANNDSDENPYTFSIQGTGTCVNVIIVTNNANSGAGSLRQAISDLCPGGTIDFDPTLSGQTITLTSGQLSIAKSLTIDGLTNSPGIFVSGNNAVRVFYVSAGMVTINNLTIQNGRNVPAIPTNIGGAGLFIDTGAAAMLNNCAVLDNATSASPTTGGGIVVNTGASLTMNNCTVSGNSSSFDSGGILNLGTLNVNNSTIVSNTTPGGGGGLETTTANTTIRNTIIAGNTGSSGPDCYTPGGTIQSADYNLVGSIFNCTISAAPNDVKGFSYASLLLGALQNNGGPNSTYALLTGSPAIDAIPGCNGAPATDQRGVSRPQGAACDVGAFEMQWSSTTTTLASSSNPSPYGQTVAFTATVTSAAGTPSGTVQFYDNGATLGAPVTLSNGQAVITTALLVVGTHPITVTYNGATGYAGSMSSVLNQQVDKATATITLGNLNQTYDGSTKPVTSTTSPLGLTVTVTYTGISGTAYGPSTTAPTATGTYNVAATINDPNYQGSANSTLTITARALTVSATGINKVYDGNTTAAVTLSDDRIAGDVLTTTYASALFDDKNVGVGKMITVSSISISGPTAGNYTANITVTTTADIIARPITVTADAQNKVYGAPDPALTYQVTGGSLATGDNLTGTLTRAAGEAVGGYAIQQGTLTAGNNYMLTYVGANLTILQADTTLALTSSLNPATTGDLITFTAQVAAVAPGAGLSTGVVTFTLDGAQIVRALDASGAATYSTSTLAVGVHPLAATYGGDASFHVSSQTLVGGQVIADTDIAQLALTSSSPTTLGQTTWFTATAWGSNVAYTWDWGDGTALTRAPIPSSAVASHIYGAVGTYTAHVTATNSVSQVVASTLVTITNLAPAANAGADQAVSFNTTVTLDGSGSTDPDGHLPLAFGWVQTSGTPIVLSSAVISRPTFTAPAFPTVLRFSLVVTDARGLRSAVASMVAITVSDAAIVGLAATNNGPNVVGNPTVLTATASGNNIVYIWNLGDGAIAGGSVVTHTYARAGTYTPVVTASNGSSVVTATTSVVINPMRIFMPLVMRNYVAAPDLVVERLSATSNQMQVVIKNQGDAPALNEFWVDVYINPTQAPTHVNQTWSMLGSQGLVWGVTADALSALTPGGVLTLTVNDAHFAVDMSHVTWPLPAGAVLYAQVDSVDAATNYGAVLEGHEILGLPYNNILGPTLSTTNEVASPPGRPSVTLRESAHLPDRP